MKAFKEKFHTMEVSTVQCLEKCHITVMKVLHLLSIICGRNNDTTLYNSKNNCILFAKLKFYWNPLSYSLFYRLLGKLTVERKEFRRIRNEMTVYIKDIEKFRETTTLILFCEVAPDILNLRQTCNLPPGFQKMVIEYEWPETVTLKDVEDFRESFFCELDLAECALMVNITMKKNIEVTWFTYLKASDFLKIKRNKHLMRVFKDFNVSTVVIDGESVYQSSYQLTKVSFILF